ALEDASKFHQRSKVDDYKHHLFIVLRVPTGQPDSFDTEQLALFLGKDYLISFQEKEGGDCLDLVRERIRKAQHVIRNLGTDYLAYAIIDAGIDAYFPMLERLGERIESLDEMIITEANADTPHRIHELKLQVLALRRSVWPMRDTINTLCRDISPYLSEGIRIYMRDCYDHLSRIIDLIEMYRELSTDFLNIYLSSVNNRMNEIIKVLTIITSLFIPPTFIAGVYGMNFNPAKSPFNMPELEWYYGYPIALLAMLITSLAILYYMKRKGWL
ncbi:MAG: magnesium/cobalt transporter CorA, partial [Candidatus Obscuribacterales bacterium]|nr:magnesium/cobalt transporter CorA [Candidatus Obscuribacterales bacterium]